jgi:hypothetical protein
MSKAREIKNLIAELEDPNPHQGDVYRHSDGDYYVVVRVSHAGWCLINTKGFNRFVEPTILAGIFGCSKSSFTKCNTSIELKHGKSLPELRGMLPKIYVGDTLVRDTGHRYLVSKIGDVFHLIDLSTGTSSLHNRVLEDLLGDNPCIFTRVGPIV